MTIKYTVVPHKVPTHPHQITYYPRFISSGQVGPREIAEDIARISTISSADTFAVLEALVQVLPKHLAAGRIVHLGDLGSFQLAVHANGAPDPDSVTPETIEGSRVHFHPGQLVRKIIEKAKYERTDQS